MEAMNIYIKPNRMAIKCPDKENFENIIYSHMMFVSKVCNFKCCFCKFRNGYIDDSVDKEYTTKSQNLNLEQMRKKIKELFALGHLFKFSGCEPLLNPYIEDYLKFVKEEHGIVFLDSNCSLTQKIKSLINKKLIDILGASLKATDKETAAKVTGNKIKSMSWDNVLESIDFAIKSNSVNRVIITYVVYNYLEKNELEHALIKFFDLFDYYRINEHLYSKIYFKVNNLSREVGNSALSSIDNALLEQTLKKISEEHVYLKNKIILIQSNEGAIDYSKIIFL